MEYMCSNQSGDISTPNGCALKLVDKFTHLGSSVSSTETDIDTRLAKAWAATIGYRSGLTDKMKRSFFQTAVVLILIYGSTTWTLTKRMEKKTCRQLNKNATSNTEQVLDTAPHKTATVRPRKLSRSDEPDMRDTAGEVGTSS